MTLQGLRLQGSGGGRRPCYFRRLSTPWLDWFACDSIEVPACERICERVNFVISSAMSVWRIRDSDAARF